MERRQRAGVTIITDIQDELARAEWQIRIYGSSRRFQVIVVVGGYFQGGVGVGS